MDNREQHRARAKISVLVVDDHPMFRDGLVQALRLEDDLEVVGEAADGNEALLKARQLEPEVMILDINLPGLNGHQVARHLKGELPNISIVFLTAYHDSEQVLHTMRVGASAYCPKDITPAKLVDIIRDVARGLYVVDDERLDERALSAWIQSNIEQLGGAYIVDSEEHYIPLSPREMEILEYVTHGMSNKEIAHKLQISQQTVKNHMTSILKKLNVEDRTQAAVNALRRGWVRMEDGNS
ncbi:MAG: response regulator transcription factor [Anaerolineaceae bacterium]|nr:response regulator transcription factor [Anaerolineaceae bacterium]